MNPADPFEEFSFKPLTEGLGFHKKATQLKNEMLLSNLAEDSTGRSIPDPPPSLDSDYLGLDETPRHASQSISDLIASLPPALDFLDDKEMHEEEVSFTPRESPAVNSSLQANAAGNPSVTQAAVAAASLFEQFTSAKQEPAMTPVKAPASVGFTFKAAPATAPSPVRAEPAARAFSAKGGGRVPAPTPVVAKGPSASLPYSEQMKNEYARAFPHADKEQRKRRIETPASELQTASSCIPAGILDGLVAIGLSSLFLVCLLAITEADLVGLLMDARTDLSTQGHLFLLIFVVANLYLLTTRSFFGATLGEWAFDVQLGDGNDQRRILYPFFALLRGLVVTATGFILIPLLSLVLQKDLGRYFSGLQLYSRP